MKWLRSAGTLRDIVPVVLLVGYDLLAVIGSMVIAVVLRFETLRWDILLVHRASMPTVLLTYLVCFYFFQLYRYHWRFAGLDTLRGVIAANIIATSAGVSLQLHLDNARMPFSVIILTCLLATILIGGQRLLLRLLATYRGRGQERRHNAWNHASKRTVILADSHGAMEVLTALGKECPAHYDVIGILDDDPRHHGRILRGVKIIGGLAQLPEMLRRNEVDEVIIALPDAMQRQIRQYVLAACRHKVAVRVVPVLSTWFGNPSAVCGRLRVQDVRVEDLLHRPPVEIDVKECSRYLTGTRVLVTGAGGSIGGELCRQISRMNPALLVLLGRGENSIYGIELELKRMAPALSTGILPLICDVRDADRLDAIIAHYRPDVIFHAAAHKHVPMMEDNAAEAVKNNIGGMRNLVASTSAHGVKRLVLISTDKAVHPKSVMGATKFLCEELARAQVVQSSTSFITVRFGNVLGSRGSVLPIFQEQIAHGGPVMVTHQDMQRYFMTIPEAVSLVLQAGAVGRSGSLFVLDMGKPVRILDLAEDVIRLSGLEPYRDIDIKISGLRPGEKLYEELFTPSEEHHAITRNRMLEVNRPQYIDPPLLQHYVNELLDAATHNNESAVRNLLTTILPSFGADESPVAIAIEEPCGIPRAVG